MPVMAAAPGASELEKLTRGHGVKLYPPDGVSVEDTDKADQLVAARVAINGERTPVFPLSNPAKTVVVSNVPPFFKNDMLRELSRHGCIVSPQELKLALRFRLWGGGPSDPVVPEGRGGSPASRSARQRMPCAHDGDSEAAQTTRGDAGTTAEVEEPAGPQGGPPGDHLDLQNERLTGEMVEQTVPRTTETVRDMEDVGVEERSLSVSTKRKSKDIKVNNDKWWDHGKVQIRLLCQQHTLNVTRYITRSIGALETEIMELEQFRESRGDRGCLETLKTKKMALANLLDTKVQGALVRSRIQDIAEMDTPSTFFFGLDRKRGQSRVIHSLLSEEGLDLTETEQIRRKAVPEEANGQLEHPLSVPELYAALQNMQSLKAPGIDGLGVDFYKAFWSIVGQDLLDVFNESLRSGSLPLSCRRVVIALLPKKGNLQDIRNWCPVSLLCSDYKILSKALAIRLREAMEHVIHRDQTYCVPSRSMVDNIHLIWDVLEVSASLGTQVGLLSLDQEKAFDRVEHSFLWRTMERFGFSAGLIAMIKVLYRGLTWKRNGLRYLGVYLGCQEMKAKNWDDIVEKVDSKLHKWNWIKPHMSFRGRVLVLNNLVASLLWHRLACLDPPSGLLAQVQSKMVDFFWDRLHWVPQLDICSSATPGVKEALIRRRMVTLEQLVAAAGPELTNAQAVSSALGVRLIQRSLGLWKQRLSTKEKGLLLLHGRGEAETDPTDDFPELHLHLDLLDLGGPLLDGCGSGSLHSMDRRILYGNIMKALNKDKLKNRGGSMEGQAGGTESSVEDSLQAPHQEEDW
ncbi:Transposon TX1 uncharacterized 149 kDa protein ORF 2 [Takifugu flavidus]|uniref:Transposon TX1 uncharacterized 149 kDa protein ORF 2 n=1 Tax=Takifugu flavidus TaxID=433684 RepID=A0A5C6PPB0_9TELE|nr:Transposon TX1 uncharacterized 149 kDa protein ORF 2 [Takifugu flavidus]